MTSLIFLTICMFFFLFLFFFPPGFSVHRVEGQTSPLATKRRNLLLAKTKWLPVFSQNQRIRMLIEGTTHQVSSGAQADTSTQMFYSHVECFKVSLLVFFCFYFVTFYMNDLCLFKREPEECLMVLLSCTRTLKNLLESSLRSSDCLGTVDGV